MFLGEVSSKIEEKFWIFKIKTFLGLVVILKVKTITSIFWFSDLLSTLSEYGIGIISHHNTLLLK